jgi:hypothetical protein
MYIYILMYMRIASRFHPRFSFFLSSAPQYVRVPASMINHIVLYTQYKLAIISDGGGSGSVSRQNGRIDRQTEHRESRNSKRSPLFLSYLPFSFSFFCINDERTVVALVYNLLFNDVLLFFYYTGTRKCI